MCGSVCAKSRGTHSLTEEMLGKCRGARTKVSGSFPPTLQHSGPFQPTERKDRGLSCGRGGGGEPCPLPCDSTMPLSPQEAAGCKPSQLCRLQGMTPRRPEGRDTSVPAVPFTRIHTPASLHCCTSVYPPLWSTECLGRYPIFGAQLTPHTHGHQVPPVRSYDGSFWRRGPHRAVWSVTLGSSRARHPRGHWAMLSTHCASLTGGRGAGVIPRGPARALPSSQPASPSSSHEAGS